jgi:hypothetical protein
MTMSMHVHKIRTAGSEPYQIPIVALERKNVAGQGAWSRHVSAAVGNLLLPEDPSFMIGGIEIKPDCVIVNMYVIEGQSLSDIEQFVLNTIAKGVRP